MVKSYTIQFLNAMFLAKNNSIYFCANFKINYFNRYQYKYIIKYT